MVDPEKPFSNARSDTQTPTRSLANGEETSHSSFLSWGGEVDVRAGCSPLLRPVHLNVVQVRNRTWPVTPSPRGSAGVGNLDVRE